MTIYHTPKNEQPMDEIYVVLSRDEDGTEGIISMQSPMGAMPMVFGHKRMLDKVLSIIKQMAKDTGKTIRICKFKKLEVIEEISGGH